ncbi:hypothetical protein PIROE2DRAFT_14425 [Piromyces sp. E2]|nr:hypothetical protein PIROE2DRAFT_14425 [Piromyces sp. E2]|eukprot:OUM59903.1 hypothetical protein PIROE2DRAFT_14425 [Piromyces sp. E2]
MILYIHSLYGLNVTINSIDMPGSVIHKYNESKNIKDDKLKKVLKCFIMNINSTVDYSTICCPGIVGIGTVDAIKCENDSECFFNKFILLNLIIHIYIVVKNMKKYEEPCTNGSECSSKKCGSFLEVPSDSVQTNSIIQTVDLIKTNYKCVDNKLNQWHIKSSSKGKGKFYSLMSSYDAKYLNYETKNNTLYMQDFSKI